MAEDVRPADEPDEGGPAPEGDQLPEDLDVTGFVGPYQFPNNNRRRIPGAIYLALIAAFPSIIFRFLPESNVFFGVLGGTSILIVVGVALDTIRQMEAQIMMRNYEGFLR